MKLLIFIEDENNNVLIDKIVHLRQELNGVHAKYETPLDFSLPEMIQEAGSLLRERKEGVKNL